MLCLWWLKGASARIPEAVVIARSNQLAVRPDSPLARPSLWWSCRGSLSTKPHTCILSFDHPLSLPWA